MNFTNCNICKRSISNNNIKKHIESCNNQITKKYYYDFKIVGNDYICNLCGKMYTKNGIYTHIWRNHINEGINFNPNIGYLNGTVNIWNKGLTKENSYSVRAYSEKNKGRPGTFKGFKHSNESKQKISLAASLNNKGGRCKWFLFNHPNGYDVSLQGTWEVRFANVLSNIDSDWIKIGIGKRNHSFNWVDNSGKKHTYTPDFYSPKLEKYYEIKGYWWGNDKEKMKRVLEQNNINIEIIQKNDLEDYENKFNIRK